MQVRFEDPAENNRQPIRSTIYLQGAILMTYDNGHWQAGLPSWNSWTDLLKRAATMPQTGLVLQKIDIKAMDHDELFYVPPFIALDSTADMSFDNARQRLLRTEQSRSREFRYKLGTTAIVNGRQSPLTPSAKRDSTKRALQFPQDDGVPSLPKLAELARRWIDESELPEDDRFGRARYLEQKLANSGQFEYSLVGQERNLELDPIEDFISEHPRGHCEYFATALCLMLRSQRIPARMVVGYKCDEWNPMGRCFQVRQLHAHTWVEVYLPFRQIPPHLIHGRGYWRWWGGWLRLDPTPAGAGHEQSASWMTPVHGAMDWLDAAWSNYVMELDYERQREAIYAPIARTARAMARMATDPESWRTFFAELAIRWHLDELRGAVAWLVIVIAGILVTAVLAAFGWLLYWAGRRLLRRWTGNRTRLARRRSKIEFYRRFETLLARQGMSRATGQTQREFAEAAGRQLTLRGCDPRLCRLPGMVADAFYRVRFGRRPLDNRQVQTVEQAIKELSEVKS